MFLLKSRATGLLGRKVPACVGAAVFLEFSTKKFQRRSLDGRGRHWNLCTRIQRPPPHSVRAWAAHPATRCAAAAVSAEDVSALRRLLRLANKRIIFLLGNVCSKNNRSTSELLF
jgi:hypothetical protein